MTKNNKYLVFTSAGDNNKNAIENWISGVDRNFDLIIYYYGNTDSKFKKYKNISKLCVKRKGMKLNNFNSFYQNYQNLISQYEYTAVWDDDLIMKTEDINKCFQLMKEYNLSLGQPSNNIKKGQQSWFKCTHQINNKILHYTSFIENGVFIINNSLLSKIFYNYPIQLQAWGSDFYYLNRINSKNEKDYAVFDCVSYINPTVDDKNIKIRETKINSPEEDKVWFKYAIQNSLQLRYPSMIYQTIPKDRLYPKRFDFLDEWLWLKLFYLIPVIPLKRVNNYYLKKILLFLISWNILTFDYLF